jgi:serine/threonine protein kinase
MKKKQNGSHLKECKTLKKMSKHPNIVQLYETFLGPSKDFYFVMEYVNGGNMYQFINDRKESRTRIKSAETKSILYQILSALYHIHQVEGIFHRDMKPENLLMHYLDKDKNDVIIKLADFGLATEIRSKLSYTDYVSTRWYRAPEVLLKSSHYSFPIDLWAVGAIFAELVSLRPLFPGQSEIDQLFRICQVLGSPSGVTTTTTKKINHHIITHKQISIPAPLKTNNNTAGIGGEWKEGFKLAQKMGFEFPKVIYKTVCLIYINLIVIYVDLATD